MVDPTSVHGASIPGAKDVNSLEDGIAEPSNTDQESVSSTHEAEEPTRKKYVFAGFAILTLLVIIVAVVLGIALSQEEDKQEASVTNPQSNPTEVPASTTEVTPNEITTSAPAGPLDLLMQNLPEYTKESLQNISTPQSKAKDWLLNHPELNGMQEFRKMQLFALGTFYYAFEGDLWNEPIRETWMQYDHECGWHYEIPLCVLRGHCPNITQCNEHDEITGLSLNRLRMDILHNYSIPAEIALLTSLSAVSITSSFIEASIAEFLPSELYQLSNLKELDLLGNRLIGQIPSQLGLLTELVALSLAHNGYLTGTIPTELGLMTSAEEIYLFDNQLTGPIPTEFGLLSAMEDLELVGNNLNGSIPTELGLLASMEMLHLQENQFTGEISSEFGSLTNLVSLSLRHSNLSGRIPSHLGGLALLQVLRLENNTLVGPIPEEFDGLAENLVRITFTGNALTGSVPEGLCSLGKYNQKAGLAFDCNPDQLCGCEWCLCQEVDAVGLADGSVSAPNQAGPGEGLVSGMELSSP